MIATIVTFRLPEPVSTKEAQAIFESTAPRYRDFPGLLRKFYLVSEDGTTAGAVYFWKERAAAEAMYTDEWHAFVRGKYGSDASVRYFASPVLVDNVAGEIVSDD